MMQSTPGPIKFILNYWRGRHSLGFSFWVVFLPAGILIYIASSTINILIRGNTNFYLLASGIYLGLSCLIMLPWLLLGLLRAAEQHYREHQRSMVLHSVQAIVLVGVVLTISHLIGKVQELLIYHNKWAAASTVIESQYTLSEENQRLNIVGDLEFGIVKAVTEVLDQHPDISLIVLESNGGQIYEGRGLGRLFDNRALDTVVLAQCSSACITAFIGGRTRKLGLSARLGFHQYALDPHKLKQFSAYYNPETEQEKDLAILRLKGVTEAFLDKVFLTPSHDMWFPSVEELIAAGVATSVIKD